jgi:hypothetical protein
MNMKNKLSDLNDLLFAQIERLSDKSVTGEKLQEEIERARTVTFLAREVISNGDLVLRAHIASEEFAAGGRMPKMLSVPIQEGNRNQ